MNDFYMDFMLRERRKNESREYERRRLLNTVRTPPGGDLRNCGRCCKDICIDFTNFFRVADLGFIKKIKT